MSINKVILIGNLGRDPQAVPTKGGTAMASFSLATHEKFKKDGELAQRTEWHQIVTFDKVAEKCLKYLSKGREVYIEGRLRTRSYTNQEGQQKYITEVKADIVDFLGKPPQRQEENQEDSTTAPWTE